MNKNNIRWHETIAFTKCGGSLWEAYNNKDEYLGELFLHMVGRHKHWVWTQCSSVYMSPSCLEEVRVKQKALFKERNSENTKNGDINK